MNPVREAVEYDVVVVGGGPAGLATAIRLRQLAAENDPGLSVCVLEKGSEIGAHILSGAVIDPRALDELIPDWAQRGAPLITPAERDEFHFLTGSRTSVKVPQLFVPRSMHNRGNYIASLGNLCRWLAEQAETLGVDIYPGFAATEILYDGDRVKGVATGSMGLSAQGREKDSFEPGLELHAGFTVFAEGSRGHLGRSLIERYQLDRRSEPQHYAIGLKELWEVTADRHQPGLVVHGAGWPLSGNASGGFFLYHLEEKEVAVGLIVDLNYRNPYLDPFQEFQRLKHHPVLKPVLEGGRRVAYGARAITKGGFNSLPRMHVPGALLVGCEAGTLDFARIKGTHTAMKSGMVAAETLTDALANGATGGADPAEFDRNFRSSWIYDELYRSRNFGPALHRFGTRAGGVFNFIDQNLCAGRLPIRLHDKSPDYEMDNARLHRPIDYAGPDNVLSFDKLSSVYLSNTNHEEDQPCHLTLKNVDTPMNINLPEYAAPEQRYCPAGVYEIMQEEGATRLRINAQNCVHCKTCDIKDPTQNIVWVPPEGGGGPNYPNM